jgi:hypothetical protein
MVPKPRERGAGRQPCPSTQASRWVLHYQPSCQMLKQVAANLEIIPSEATANR